MSIEMENPKTVLEKVDCAWNLVEQIRLALMTQDKMRALDCVEQASMHLGDAVQMLQEEEEK